MKTITLKMTVEELRLLVSLASDQLFRREFIDPRMPGYRAPPGELASGKSLVGRLRSMLDEDRKGGAPAQSSPAPADGSSKRLSRTSDAV
jgi:hypothetical protein